MNQLKVEKWAGINLQPRLISRKDHCEPPRYGLRHIRPIEIDTPRKNNVFQILEFVAALGDEGCVREFPRRAVSGNCRNGAAVRWSRCRCSFYGGWLLS